jgi:hypothetical protein
MGAVLPHISRRLLLVIVRPGCTACTLAEPSTATTMIIASYRFYAFCGEQLLVSGGESNIDPAKHAWAILAKLEAADDSSSGQMLKTGTRATCGLDPLIGKANSGPAKFFCVSSKIYYWVRAAGVTCWALGTAATCCVD